MGEKKKLRTLIWKNEQFKKSVDAFIKNLRDADKNNSLPGEEKKKENMDGQ